jgi:hypothetical protein
MTNPYRIYGGLALCLRICREDRSFDIIADSCPWQSVGILLETSQVSERIKLAARIRDEQPVAALASVATPFLDTDFLIFSSHTESSQREKENKDTKARVPECTGCFTDALAWRTTHPGRSLYQAQIVFDTGWGRCYHL